MVCDDISPSVHFRVTIKIERKIFIFWDKKKKKTQKHKILKYKHKSFSFMENFGVFNENSCLLAPVLNFKDHETFTNNN